MSTLCASVAEDLAVACPVVEPKIQWHSFHPSVERVSRAAQSVNGAKSLGPDGLSADLLQAGGETVAGQIQHIIVRTIQEEYVPCKLRGGRQSNLYKGKGDAQVCDNSRGLLISDHVGKVLTSMLQAEILIWWGSQTWHSPGIALAENFY
eukprot:4939253-Karenia_brevis.AAC.1